MRKIALGALVAVAITIVSQGTTFAATRDMTVAAIRDFTPTTIENTFPETPDDLSNQDHGQGDE
jgi:hypothetical protein